MTNSTALLRPDIQRPKWAQLVQAFDRAYCERRFNEILRSRNEQQVREAWSNCALSWECVQQTCKVIEDRCSWPTSFFFPGDNAGVVFKLGSFGLDDVQLWNSLTEQGLIASHPYAFDDLPGITLGGFLAANHRV